MIFLVLFVMTLQNKISTQKETKNLKVFPTTNYIYIYKSATYVKEYKKNTTFIYLNPLPDSHLAI